VNVYYLKSNKLDAKGNAQLATNVEDVKYVALNIQNPENIIDGATIETDPLQFIDVDKHNKTIGFLSFMVKKGDIVPNPTTKTNDNKIAWKSGQNGTFYPQMNAGGAWGTAFTPADAETFDLTQFATGLDTYDDLSAYKWTISKIAYNTTTEADFVQPTLDFGTGIQSITSTRTADVSTSGTTGGTATNFDLSIDPTVVKYAKAVTITISDYAGVAGLSRTSLSTAPAAGDPHVYQTITLNFKNIWNYQTYECQGLTYIAGAKGTAYSATNTQTQEFYVSQSNVANGLCEAWADAVSDGASNPKVATAAVKDYSGTTALELADIWDASKNSVYDLFAGAVGTAGFGWNPANYVTFATEKSVSTLTADDRVCYYVKSDNGAINEYITPTYLGLTDETDITSNVPGILTTEIPVGTAFAFTATTGAPTLLTKINQTLVIKVKDAFGLSHDLSIPFELVP